MKKQEDSVTKLKSLLRTSLLICLCSLIFVKYTTLVLRKEIREIEKKTFLLEKENHILTLEWTYLTNPTRLQKLAEITKNNTTVTSAKNLKQLNYLVPYYAEKSREQNEQNPIALDF